MEATAQEVKAIFQYEPIKGLSETAMNLFAVLTVMIIINVSRCKTERWMRILTLSSLLEALGYFFRILCILEAKLGLYIAMDICLLLAPHILSFICYETIGSILRYSKKESKKTWNSARTYDALFLSGLVLAAMLQITGVCLLATKILKNTGRVISLIGYSINLGFLVLFFIIAYRATGRNSKYWWVADGIKKKELRMPISRMVHKITMLLIIRVIYRLVLHSKRYDGEVAKREWPLYTFDGLVVLVCFFVELTYVGCLCNDVIDEKNNGTPKQGSV